MKKVVLKSVHYVVCPAPETADMSLNEVLSNPIDGGAVVVDELNFENFMLHMRGIAFLGFKHSNIVSRETEERYLAEFYKCTSEEQINALLKEVLDLVKSEIYVDIRTLDLLADAKMLNKAVMQHLADKRRLDAIDNDLPPSNLDARLEVEHVEIWEKEQLVGDVAVATSDSDTVIKTATAYLGDKEVTTYVYNDIVDVTCDTLVKYIDLSLS